MLFDVHYDFVVMAKLQLKSIAPVIIS